MSGFAAKANELRHVFAVLTIIEKEGALRMLEGLVEEFSQTILREKVQMEADLTIADHAGRIILERFADDFMAIESNSSVSIWQNSEEYFNKFDDVPIGTNFMASVPQQTNNDSNNVRIQEYGDVSIEQINDDIPSISMHLGKILNDGYIPDEILQILLIDPSLKPFLDHRGQQASSSALPANSTEYICATCNFVANNRKTLYRHGLRESHVTRQSIEKVGQYKCALCDFVTNKKYNYDRHLQRTHFAIRNHECAYCDAKFKDNDTLKNHLKTVHSSITVNHRFSRS